MLKYLGGLYMYNKSSLEHITRSHAASYVYPALT